MQQEYTGVKGRRMNGRGRASTSAPCFLLFWLDAVDALALFVVCRCHIFYIYAICFLLCFQDIDWHSFLGCGPFWFRVLAHRIFHVTAGFLVLLHRMGARGIWKWCSACCCCFQGKGHTECSANALLRIWWPSPPAKVRAADLKSVTSTMEVRAAPCCSWVFYIFVFDESPLDLQIVADFSGIPGIWNAISVIPSCICWGHGCFLCNWAALKRYFPYLRIGTGRNWGALIGFHQTVVLDRQARPKPVRSSAWECFNVSLSVHLLGLNGSKLRRIAGAWDLLYSTAWLPRWNFVSGAVVILVPNVADFCFQLNGASQEMIVFFDWLV